MILSDITIKKLIKQKKLIVKPYKEENVQSASLDLRLGMGFLVPDSYNPGIISLDEEVKYKEIDKGKIIIPPHHFILATTLEHISLPDYITGRIDGRSSIGRRGLFIQNAGWIDPGFRGNITLELYNSNECPIEVYSGRRICQIVFQFTDRPVKEPYRGKYLGQRGTTGSLAHKDLDKEKRRR